jgi:outer membrane protein
MNLMIAMALLGQPILPNYSDDVTSAAQLQCAPNTRCVVGLTAADLLRASETYVLDGKYAEAQPLLAALAADNQFPVERQFLEGLVASKTGDLPTAVQKFRTVLTNKPSETRVRFELARALYDQGHKSAADYHFKLAEQSTAKLPPDVARVISGYRRAIRAQKGWSFGTQIGIAPDTNINSATNDRQVDIFGLPFDLNESARQKSGVGQIVGAQGQARIKLTSQYDIDVIGAATFTNYNGTEFDDFGTTFSVGPSRQFNNTRVGLGATVSQRWFGGDILTRGIGLRAFTETRLSHGADLSTELSLRKVDNFRNNDYDGGQLALSVTYEQPLKHQLVASFGLTAKHDILAQKEFGSTDVGLFAGLGAELPWGMNAGVSLQGGWNKFGEASFLFGKTRSDWRIDGQAYLGLRSIRFLGFSPSVNYSYAFNRSNISLYNYNRHRFEFSVARYF